MFILQINMVVVENTEMNTVNMLCVIFGLIAWLYVYMYMFIYGYDPLYET
jgi:hypothetical protein